MLIPIDEVCDVLGSLLESAPNAANWLGELSALAARHEDEEALLGGIARVVADAFKAPSVRIWALSPDNEQLGLRAATGLVLPFEALQDRVPVHGSELGRVIQHRESCVIDCDDPATPEDVRTWAQRAGVASFLAVPIANGEQPWGVLGLFSRARFTTTQREQLSAAATVIGGMLSTRVQGDDSADLLPSLIPCLSSAIITLDRTGRITRWSSEAERLFGWSEAELLGQPLPIVPDEHRHEYTELNETSQRVNHSRTICQRADLSRVPVLRTSAPFFDGHGAVIGRVEVFADDSQRVHTSRCLHVQAEVTRILAGCRGIDDAMPLLLAALGNWLGCDVLEFWRRDESQGLLAPAGVWAKLTETRDRLAATGIRLRIDAADWPARAHRDDDVTYAEDIVSPTASAILPTAGSLRVATAGLAIPIRSSDRRWGIITCLGHSLAAPDELTRQTLGFTADALAQFLTRLQTETELARTEASLRQSQKMDAIGLLAGGVAHDFNNLLTIILAYSEMGLTDIDESHPLHELFAEIHGAGERAAGMTKKLLAVSRQQPTQTVTCSLNQLVCEMDRMLQRLLGPQIALQRDFQSDAAPVWADVNQLEQVLLNLVVNARDAMPTGGTITVRTRNYDVSPRAARQHGVKPGDYVELAVADTGCGMDATTKARIFEPFFTTKAAGKGTGMGLATVFGIVQQSGGYLVVDSELNRGTTFSVFLPQSRERLATQSITGQLEPSPVGTESILVVEPDDALRGLIRRLLEVRGYTVHEAMDGGEVLKRLNARKPGIDLVLGDLQSAGVDQLVQQLRNQPNGLRLLLMSGNAEPPAEWKLDPARQVLRKPFTSAGLARQVRLALG